MRCKACDTMMTDYELSRKDSNGQYYDLCGHCLSHSIEAETVDVKGVDIDPYIRYDDNNMYDSIRDDVVTENYFENID